MPTGATRSEWKSARQNRTDAIAPSSDSDGPPWCCLVPPNMMSDQPPDLSPSAEFVRYVLSHQGPCTRDELMAETNRAESTIYDALDRLDDHDLLERVDTETDSYIRYDLRGLQNRE